MCNAHGNEGSGTKYCISKSNMYSPSNISYKTVFQPMFNYSRGGNLYKK